MSASPAIEGAWLEEATLDKWGWKKLVSVVIWCEMANWKGFVRCPHDLLMGSRTEPEIG